MHFDETLRYLLSLGHETLAIKLGLKNTELLLTALGNPQAAFKSVQIAGTNGKGSTAVMLDAICRAAEIRTGLFTSPHLVSITERFKISGAEISENDFARLATAVRFASDSLVKSKQLEAPPTFFEQVTAIAFLAFKEAQVDLAILETGLGGRLDSTTTARAETVAITPIALDHQEYLGETLAEIATEKAAIIQPNVSAIVALQPPEALAVILRRCDDVGARRWLDDCAVSIESATEDGRLCVTFKTSAGQYTDVLLGLRGRHQVGNAAVAIQLAESLRERGFEISRAAIVSGIEQADHPARLELREGQPSILFDGAHNPAGAQALREYLAEFIHSPITLIFGAMRDKNLEAMAAILFPVADQLVLTEPANPRAARLETLEQIAAGKIDWSRIFSVRSATEALRVAREITTTDGPICITGSLYLIGEMQAELAVNQAQS